MKTTVVIRTLRGRSGADFARVFSMLLITALAVATSCKDDDAEPSVKESACLVANRTTAAQVRTGKPDGYSYKSVFTYEYDDKGNQIGNTVQYDYTYNDGKKSTSTSSTSMQYDADGFLLRTIRQYNSTDMDGVISNSSTNEEYTYENGRLIKEAYTNTTDGKPSNYVFQYEYDGAGKLIKYSNTYNNSSTAITYNGEIIQKITKTDGGGNVTSPFVQYNAKGWLTKWIDTWPGGTDEYRYEYTADGQVAKEERYINSKPSSGGIYEYDTRENPNRYIESWPKGHPVVPDYRAKFVYIRNITRATYLEPNAGETAFQNRASELHVYDYNEKGFPTGYTSTTTNATGEVANSYTVTYEYANCN
ncbi:hypothetical protein KK062_09125 [Fulvivirgaceae bacterium PWU5]|uniref:YD repeat-containing protein n=1 Tax=Dawidia cretensis TaxID=2782350 RepID=A0AAP2DVZ8_9BACT|nr:hypothetical protein [Dawidia cretensis]MBT1708385.1 hypothetical protein [Dawidia cretensis]